MKQCGLPERYRDRTGACAALFAALCACLPSPVTAQSPAPTPWRTVGQDHLWVATFIDQPMTSRWAFLGDVQWRRTEAGRNPQQLLTRGSLTYRVTPGFRLGAGVLERIPLSVTKRLDVLWLQQWIPVSRARASENNRAPWIVLNHTGKAR